MVLYHNKCRTFMFNILSQENESQEQELEWRHCGPHEQAGQAKPIVASPAQLLLSSCSAPASPASRAPVLALSE